MKLRKLLLLMDGTQPVKVVTDIDGQGESFIEVYRGVSSEASVVHGDMKIIDVRHDTEYLEIEVE